MDMDAFNKAHAVLKQSSLFRRTPAIANCYHLFKDIRCNDATKLGLNLKLEHMQSTGSFKIRGVVNQFHHAPESIKAGQQQLVTMSAGNYGRAFAEVCCDMKLRGRVILPDSAPINRLEFIKSKGLDAEFSPAAELTARVNEYVEQGAVFMHPFDDERLFHGYGTASLEIFEDLPDTEVLVTCCGGGGFLAGTSSAAKLLSPNCRIYGVEPETANSMYRSFQAGEAVQFPGSKSIASGLSPPYAGKNAYRVCRQRVSDILLVTEDEIKAAVSALYSRGLVVEPAGSAAFAAFMFDKIPDVEGKTVTVILTGSNVSPGELLQIV